MKNQTLGQIDTKLTEFSKRWVVGLTVVKGIVNVKGRLETHKSWDTTRNNYTLGKFGRSGWFGAYNTGRSHTDEIKMHKLNLLKIEQSQFVELIVPSTALADSLKEKQRVACIFSADRSRLYYVANHDTGIALGFIPNWNGLQIGTFIGYGIASIAIFSAFSSPQSFVIALFVALGFGAIGRIAQLALKRSKEVWTQALGMVQTP